LFNAFTEILKGNLGALPRRTQALHGLMDAACGLVIPGTGHRTEAAETRLQPQVDRIHALRRLAR
jgi:hypothetical protein